MIKSSKKIKSVFHFSTLLLFSCILFQNAFGQDKPRIIVEENNCESNNASLDYVLQEANNNPFSMLIVIARLGDGEKKQKYNERRLYELKMFMTEFRKFPPEKIVTAQGERVNGKGQVDVYIGGRLFAIFKVGRKENLRGRNCNN